MNDRMFWDRIARIFSRLQRWAKRKASESRLEYMDPNYSHDDLAQEGE